MGRLKAKKANEIWRRNIEALGELSDVSTLREVRLRVLPDMAAACEMDRARQRFQSIGGERTQNHKDARREAQEGNPADVARAVEESDSLIAGAIAHEPRLAKRAQWTRAEDGIFADPGLVASGDDAPCYDMTRARLQDFAASGDAVNVVISTDSSTPASLPAFMATVRLVQQFRPVNVFWQGAWLCDDGREAGYVFNVPLVRNDMDFSRVQFVVSSRFRDHLSFSVVHGFAHVQDKFRLRGLGRPADRSYIPGARFVGPKGIDESPEAIAAVACQWLGWESPYWRKVEQEEAGEAALQKMPPKFEPYIDRRTPEEKRRQEARDKAWREEREQEQRKRAQERAEAAGHMAGVC